MNAARALIQSAESMGIILWVDGANLRYRAKQPVSDGFKDRIRMHKAEIINLLTMEPDGAMEAVRPTLPKWCESTCHQLEAIELPLDGTTHGCIQQRYGFEQWTRLTWMKACPNKLEDQTKRSVSGATINHQIRE